MAPPCTVAKEHAYGATTEMLVQCALETVSSTYGHEIDDILRSHCRHTAFGRRAMFWLSHDVLGCSSTEVGRLLGRDHSTVLAGVHRMRAAMGADEHLRREALSMADAALAKARNDQPPTEVVSIRPGDVVVVSGLPAQRAAEVEEWLHEHLPGTDVLVLEQSASVAVLRAGLPATRSGGS